MSRPAHERAIAVGLLALLAARAAWGLAADASVADEHPHILSGWLYWQSGRFAGGADNPPLGQLWVALPLHLLHLPYAFASDAFLGWSRAPVVLSLVGLGVLVWRWGRALGGPAVGLVALGALAFEPNLVAHGHLATLDAPLAVAWWAALWAWRGTLGAWAAGRDAGAGGRAWRRGGAHFAAFAFAAAAATLVKFTGLLLYPAAWCVALATPGVARQRATLAITAALATALVLAHVAYGFAPLQYGLPEPLVAGLRGKIAHRDEVHFAYLAGQRSETGFLLYYVAALLVKTPLPLLIAAAWGVARRIALVDRLLLAVPAVVVVAAFTLVRVNVGVRHVLPVLPALVLFAALGLVDLARRGRRGRAAAVVLGAVWVAGVARVAPQDLAYFNELAGGPAGGHRFLLDSNLAWGQDDGRLQSFLAAAAARGESWQVLPERLVPRPGRIAVDCNSLHNLNRTSERPYEWLRALRPARFAGWSWRLYDLRPEDFARAAAARPRDAAAQWGWAEIRRAGGDPAGADSVLRVAATHDPAGIAARVARCGLDNGDWRRAQAWLRAAPRNPEIEALARRAALQAALAAADSAAAPVVALELGLWHAEGGEIELALPLLARAAAGRPHDAMAQRAHAVALAHAGRWAEAAAILSRAELAGRFAAEREACLALAWADSVVATGAAVGAHQAGSQPGVYMELGRAHFEAQRFEPAAHAFAAVLAQDPGARLAASYLGEMQVRCKMRIVDQTLPPLRIVPRRVRR